MARFGKFRETVEGHVDGVSDTGVITGWARSLLNPLERITISALCDGKVLGLTSADCFRRDLAELEIGDAKYGFEVQIDLTKFTDEELIIDVIAQNGMPLVNSPVRISMGTLASNAVSRLDRKRVNRHHLNQRMNRDQFIVDRARRNFVDLAFAFSCECGNELGVRILYWTWLQRSPDIVGMDHKLFRLAKGQITTLQIAEEILNSDEFKSKNLPTENSKTLEKLLKLFNNNQTSKKD